MSGKASLNVQATDPKSHTSVRGTHTGTTHVLSPANFDGRPHFKYGARTIRMCSLDGRSGTNTGANPRERSERAWKDHLEG